jgi:hypothetical protein
MALSAEETKLMEEIRKGNADIAKLREHVIGLKKEYEAIQRKRQLEHKMGTLSDEDRAALAGSVKH